MTRSFRLWLTSLGTNQLFHINVAGRFNFLVANGRLTVQRVSRMFTYEHCWAESLARWGSWPASSSPPGSVGCRAGCTCRTQSAHNQMSSFCFQWIRILRKIHQTTWSNNGHICINTTREKGERDREKKGGKIILLAFAS